MSKELKLDKVGSRITQTALPSDAPESPRPQEKEVPEYFSVSLSSVFTRPPKYVVASLVISLGGTLFGLDTGCIGPVTSMPIFLATFGPFSSTIHGLVVSSILIPASIMSFFAGHFADKVGRTNAVMVGALVFAVGAGVEGGAVALGMFVAGRVIKGLGEGLFLSTLTVYVCEISPADRRGPLGSVIQILISIGVCCGFFICYGTVKIPSSLAWRLPSVIQATLAVILAICCPTLPGSPRWMIAKGRYAEAYATLDRLGLSRTEFEDDPTATPPATDKDPQSGTRFLTVFQKGYRKQTFLAVFLMAMCQCSGIDGVLYYAPTLFKQAGLSGTTSVFLASGVSGLVIMVVTVPASILADRWDRRTSVISGGVVTGACMILIGALYAADSVHAGHGVGRWVVIVSIYVYIVGFNTTWAVILRVYSTEVQPARTRAAATSLGQASNWVANFVIAFTTPIFLANSTCGAYFMFGFFALLTAVVCVVYMPETRGRSLEAIEASFCHSPLGAFLSRIISRPGKKEGGREGENVGSAV